jgi:hypothetical protein
MELWGDKVEAFGDEEEKRENGGLTNKSGIPEPELGRRPRVRECAEERGRGPEEGQLRIFAGWWE